MKWWKLEKVERWKGRKVESWKVTNIITNLCMYILIYLYSYEIMYRNSYRFIYLYSYESMCLNIHWHIQSWTSYLQCHGFRFRFVWGSALPSLVLQSWITLFVWAMTGLTSFHGLPFMDEDSACCSLNNLMLSHQSLWVANARQRLSIHQWTIFALFSLLRRWLQYLHWCLAFLQCTMHCWVSWLRLHKKIKYSWVSWYD